MKDPNGQSFITSLKPRLGMFTTTAIIMGTMIGSGIFKKAAPMAALLGSPELLLLVWVVAGIVTLFGALTNAEITSMMPVTGGQYKYYQIMYGDLFAFMSGWAVFTVIQTGSIAAIAYVFSDYCNSIVHLPILGASLISSTSFSLPVLGVISVFDNFGVKLLTMLVIIVLTIVNYRGVHVGGLVSGVFSTLKVVAIIAIIIFCAVFSGGAVSNFANTQLAVPTGSAMILAFTLAMSKAFWAYDGWGSISYIGGEIRDAQTTIPRSLILGVSSVIILYLLINCGYLYILPMHEMAVSNLVAADVMSKVLGTNGAAFIAAVVMISTLGATNGTILNSARVYYAMAKDRMFFSPLAKVHPQYATPSTALVVQCLWSCALVLSGTFETLTDMLIFVSWMFYGMSAYGVFILRKKLPDQPRPYKVWGYPVVPAVFVVVSFLFVLLTLVGDVKSFLTGTNANIPSLTGLIITATGIPMYYFFLRRKTSA